MKHLKHLLTVALTMLVALAVATPAYASDYKITVTNTNDTVTISGKTYTAYKLFDMTYSGSNATDPHSYTIDSDGDGAWAWGKLTEGLTADANGKYTNTTYGLTFTPSAADATVYVVDGTNMTDAQARALADALQSLRGSATKSASGTVADGAETVTIDVGEAGYWLVYGVASPKDPQGTPAEEVVAACALNSADPTVTINPKVSIPTITKEITKVQEGTVEVPDALLDPDGQAAVAKVGSTVSYELDSVVPDLRGYTDYTFTFNDAITAGLDYVTNSFKLTIKGEQVDIAPDIAQDGKSFTLTIPYSVLSLAKYSAGDAIVLTYDATVNANALTYDYEKNTASLTYSHSPYDNTTNKTPDKETYVLDLNIDVLKINGEDEPKKLDGAEFKLYREVTTGTGNDAVTTREFYKWANNKVTWVAEADADVFVTDANGNLTQQVRGLDKGTYFLLETKAPEGYNLLAGPVTVVISATEAIDAQDTHNKVTYSATYNGEDAAMTNGVVDLNAAQTAAQPVATGTIVNESGVELPSTGGIGTTIFYVIGGAMVITAGVLLVTKRRMAKIEA